MLYLLKVQREFLTVLEKKKLFIFIFVAKGKAAGEGKGCGAFDFL